MEKKSASTPIIAGVLFAVAALFLVIIGTFPNIIFALCLAFAAVILFMRKRDLLGSISMLAISAGWLLFLLSYIIRMTGYHFSIRPLWFISMLSCVAGAALAGLFALAEYNGVIPALRGKVKTLWWLPGAVIGGFSLLYAFSIPRFFWQLTNSIGAWTPIIYLMIAGGVMLACHWIAFPEAASDGSAAPAYQPVPQQPVYQPTPAAPAYQPAPEAAPERTMPQQPAAPAGANGFVDIDIRQYNPIDSGVSMKMGKDYKFHRADGFVGSVPQKFVDRTFAKCPICCTNQPNWTIAQHNQMSWKGNLYLFKCSCCDGVVSMSMPDVTTLGNGGGGFAANANVGLTNLIAKKSSGKDATAVYAVIETVGRSGMNPDCQGKEIKLEDMQQLSMRM